MITLVQKSSLPTVSPAQSPKFPLNRPRPTLRHPYRLSPTPLYSQQAAPFSPHAPSSNPHRPLLLDLGSPPAVSFFGDFRTPANRARGDVRRWPASENLHIKRPSDHAAGAACSRSIADLIAGIPARQQCARKRHSGLTRSASRHPAPISTCISGVSDSRSATIASFDDLVGASQDCRGYREAERLCGI